MEIDKEKQAQAMARAQEILVSAEKKREAARVEKGIQLFLKGNYEVLENDELVENLGTIARSGTAEFLNQMTGDQLLEIGNRSIAS